MQEKKLTIVNFSERFRHLIDGCGLSQKDLASALGLSEGSIVNYKKGRIPKAEELLTITSHFGVSLEWLLSGQNSEDYQAPGGRKPLYNSSMSVRSKALKAADLEREADELRNLARRLKDQSKTLLDEADKLCEIAAMLLEDDDDEDEA